MYILLLFIFLRKIRHTGTLWKSSALLKIKKNKKCMMHDWSVRRVIIPYVICVIQEPFRIMVLYQEPCMTQIHQCSVYSLRKLRHTGTLWNSSALSRTMHDADRPVRCQYISFVNCVIQELSVRRILLT